MESIKELNKQLENGIVPECLNYSKPIQIGIVDIGKLQYNAFYRSYEYFEKKYPENFIKTFGLEPMIQEIIELKKDIDIKDEFDSIPK